MHHDERILPSTSTPYGIPRVCVFLLPADIYILNENFEFFKYRFRIYWLITVVFIYLSVYTYRVDLEYRTRYDVNKTF